MVVVDLEGKVAEGKWKPSSDTPTHVELYKAFPNLGGIVHTHSSYATSWAQAGRDVPCYGTTHADCFYGDVPCLRCLTREEIEEAYEKNTGLLIVSEFARLGKDPKAVPGCLCKNHGPFAWAKNACAAGDSGGAGHLPRHGIQSHQPFRGSGRGGPGAAPAKGRSAAVQRNPTDPGKDGETRLLTPPLFLRIITAINCAARRRSVSSAST